MVRSTHGVNCTGSCSWKVFVKDGIITWEAQQTDYPSTGPDRPEYEPRGCPRGAAFSWYTYSPTRVRYPYVRGVLLEMYREAKARLGDPVLAWADVVGDPVRSARYKAARGKGGLVRASWAEAVEMVAAAHVHTIKEHGPDRIAGFSPIPAMSMVSHGVGARFYALLGAPMLSFYDWYADLPVASPQVFGDQTDVPESGDWWDAGYLIMWGSNVPVTRTPDAHWMVEARYRGQKVVAVSPGLRGQREVRRRVARAGARHRRRARDGDGARDPARVLRRADHAVLRRVREAVHRPAVPRSRSSADGDGFVPGKFLTAADLGETSENAQFKTVLLDETTGRAGGARTARSGSGSAPRGRGAGTSTSASVEPQLSAGGRPGPGPAAVTLPAVRRGRRLRGEHPAGRPDAAGGRPHGHHGVRPAARAVRRRPPGTARDLAHGVRRRRLALHPRLAGGDHRGAGRQGGEDRPRVRRQRGGVEGPVDDPHGRRHQPLVPRRHHLPRVPHAHRRCAGRRASTAAAGRTTWARRRSARSPGTACTPTRSTGRGRRGT